jgi:excisionase family DNA binding protein
MEIRVAHGQDINEKRIAHSIEAACRISGLGRTSIYAALKSGALPARKCGRRTLILADDLDAFLRNLPPVHGQPRSVHSDRSRGT